MPETDIDADAAVNHEPPPPETPEEREQWRELDKQRQEKDAERADAARADAIEEQHLGWRRHDTGDEAPADTPAETPRPA